MKLSNFGIIVQARTGSKRLPGKVFKRIGNKTILEHIASSLKKENLLHKTIIATTKLKRDNKIVYWCKKNKIKFFCGNNLNVLDRYYKCASKYKLKNIIRLTADNPFVNVSSIRKLIKHHLKNNFDYTSSIDFLPVGIGTEIFSYGVLEKSFNEGKKKTS